MPKTVIKRYLFEKCSSLIEISIPDSVTSVEEWAFAECAITSITLPDNLTTVGDYAFWGCFELTDIRFGSGIESISDTAFAYCSSLSTAYYNGDEDAWAQVAKSEEAFSSVEIIFASLTGDVNGDGYVDNLDASVILKYDAGIIDLDGTKSAAADVNGDGYVDNLDASRILKYDAGIIPEL